MTDVPELFVFDFDRTLAHRSGTWSQCLFDVLDAQVAGHGVTSEDLRPHLRDGFPWHRPDIAHPELNDPDEWWRALGDLLDRVYRAVGVDSASLGALRDGVRAHYCDGASFELYPDTIRALEVVRAAGARSVILSNHVPELESIVAHLGLEPLIDEVLTSARIGFEKPNPYAFRAALGPTDPSDALMIGDNPAADRQGALEAGMRAALVRHPASDFDDVLAAVEHATGHDGIVR